MQELFQSAFLQALGKSILASLWQMGLLFLIYHLLVLTLRIKKPSLKNFLSSFFVLGGFAWFLFTLLLQGTKETTASLVIEDSGLQNNILHSFTNYSQWHLLANWIEYKLHFILPYLSAAYLFVLVWFMLKLFVRLQSAQSLRSSGITEVNEELKSFFLVLTESIGISRSVQLFISSRIDIPATVGFLKPVVLLPASAITMLSPAQLEAVLLHELAHIKRYDYFWNILLSVAETILFFNPFALLFISIARKERENSCDDVVMAFQQNAAVYAEALLNVEKARMKTPVLAMALGDDNKQYLLNRVKRILNIPAERNKISTRLLALVFFTFVFALMGWIIKGKNQLQTATGYPKHTVLAQPENTFYIKPETVIKNNNEIVTLRDQQRQIRIELKKEKNTGDVFVWNEREDEEVKFDKIVFDDMPSEILQKIIQPGSHPLLADDTHSTTEPALFDLRRDSAAITLFFREDEEHTGTNTVRRGSRARQAYIIFPNEKMMFKMAAPNARFSDTVFDNFREMVIKNNSWNNKALKSPDFHTYNYHYNFPGEVKKMQEQKNTQMKKNRLSIQRYIREIRNRDSVAEARLKNLHSFYEPNQLLYAEDILKKNDPLRVYVENGQVYIKGAQIICTDSSAVYQQHEPKKVVKKLEIIKL
jgi:beta-lactamase regulating signal transducer with metallopeptidase domain